MSDWRQYQEDVANFFRELGMTARTDVTVDGVRTTHDIDVVVDSLHAGFQVRWLIECKHWKARVPKEVVHAFRTIVNETGADRGFIMAEKGFQSGAIEASVMSSVNLTSLARLRIDLANELAKAKYAQMSERIELADKRYWAMNKYHRIDWGLRPEAGFPGYSGAGVLGWASAAILHAAHYGFPLVHDETAASNAHSGRPALSPRGAQGECLIETPQALILVLDAELTELEGKLAIAEANIGSR